jgi:hypothetical protein
MSRKNLQLVTKGFRAALTQPRPDFETMNEVFSPDHVFVPAFAQVAGEEFEGKDWYAQFKPVRPGDAAEQPISWADNELDGVVDLDGDQVLVVFHGHFQGSASGVAMEWRGWGLVTVRHGKIVRTELHSNPAQALAAAERDQGAAQR